MIHRHDLLRIVGLTVFLFSILIWLYVVLIQVTHPDYLYAPFSHIGIFPFNWRVDDVGMTAFACAVIGFLMWQIERMKKTRS